MVKKYEKRILISVVSVFIIIQVLIVTFINVEQTSDSLFYLKSAYSTIEAGKLYPTESNLNDMWIRAPGWVNLIALLLSVFGSIKSLLYFNILLNTIILGALYYISRRFFGLKSAIISLFLFVLLLSNYGIILLLMTELVTVALLLGSFCFFIQNNFKYYLLSGILVGLANWVRPFAPAIFVILLISFLILKLPLRWIIPWVLGLLISVILIGGVTYFNSGQFINSSITTGCNMIIGSNPLAKGSYDAAAFSQGGMGYIPNESSLNVKEKDAIWKKRAVEWAMNNPVDWIKLIPKKLFYLYSYEVNLIYHLRPKPPPAIFADDVKGIHWFLGQKNLVFNNIIYLFILSMSLLSIYFVFKNKFSAGYIALLYIFVLTGITILTFGNDRFHYPMIPAMILLASYCIENLSIRFSSSVS